MSHRSQVKHPHWLPRRLRPTPPVLRRARAFAHRTFGDRLEEAAALEGFLRRDEGAVLCLLASESPPGAILEIGSFRGKSTVFLARGATDAHTVVAVDPQVQEGGGWAPYRETLRAWDVDDRIESIRRFSYDLRPEWTRPLAMLWIDGDHGYDAVRRDIEDWVDLVVPGGHLGFHDTHPHHTRAHGWGVREAIVESDAIRREFEAVIELRNAWFFRRRP